VTAGLRALFHGDAGSAGEAAPHQERPALSYLGDPIEVLLLRDGVSELVVVGPNIVGGHRVQLFIPGGTFHTAHITGKRRWFLGASTEWPGVVLEEDVELGDANQLAAKFPEAAADIRTFPVPVEK
jgi:hypothetical protein